MTFELIARPRRTIAPGVVHVPDWLTVAEQRELADACRGWAQVGPGARRARLPGGAQMSVATVCLGWHWIPYRYSPTRDDQDGSPALPLPDWLRDMGRDALRDAYEDRELAYDPDVALVNFYDGGARLGLHQDREEQAPDPVVSFSLGAACVFRIGNTAHRGRPWTDLELNSGDLVVFGRENRLAYHGVPKMLAGREVPELGLPHGTRINVTLRVTDLESAPSLTTAP